MPRQACSLAIVQMVVMVEVAVTLSANPDLSLLGPRRYQPALRHQPMVRLADALFLKTEAECIHLTSVQLNVTLTNMLMARNTLCGRAGPLPEQDGPG